MSAMLLRATWCAVAALLAAALPACGAAHRVYGARAARYVDVRCKMGSTQPAVYLGKVLSDVARQSNPPAEVLLTSEVVASTASRAKLRLLGHFCFAPQVPRILRFDAASGLARTAGGAAADCVDLLAYRVLP